MHPPQLMTKWRVLVCRNERALFDMGPMRMRRSNFSPAELESRCLMVYGNGHRLATKELLAEPFRAALADALDTDGCPKGNPGHCIKTARSERLLFKPLLIPDFHAIK